MRKFIVLGSQRHRRSGNALPGISTPFSRSIRSGISPATATCATIIPAVVNKFMDCGDLERGFAAAKSLAGADASDPRAVAAF